MQFFISRNKRDKQGPLSLEAITKLIYEEALAKEDLVWKEGLDDWVPASELPELQNVFRRQPPPLNQTKRKKPENTKHASEKNLGQDSDPISEIDLKAYRKRYGGVTIYFLLLWLVEFGWSVEDSAALSKAAMLTVDIDYGYCLAEALGVALGIAGLSFILTKWIVAKEVRWGGRLVLTALLLWLTLPDLHDDSRYDTLKGNALREEVESDLNERKQTIGGREHRVIPVPQ